MPDESAIHDAIERIYDAATSDMGWAGASQSVTQLLNGNTFVLQVANLKTKSISVLSGAGLDANAVEDYERYYWARDLWAIAGRETIPQDTAMAASRVVSVKNWLSSEIYNDFCLKACPMAYCLGAVFPLGSQFLAQIGVHRPAGPEDFNVNDERLLQYLLPHLRRALRISVQLNRIQHEHMRHVEALNSLPVGVLIVDQRSRVVYANKPGERLLSAGDGLRRTVDGTLVAQRPLETRALHRLIAAAAPGGGDVRTGGTTAVSRPTSTRPLSVLVSPLRQDRIRGIDVADVAFLFIHDPADRPIVPAQALRQLYGLTTAEARLAVELASGTSLEQISKGAGVSLNTARTHLKQVFRKLDINRQSELTALIASLSATLPFERS